MKKAQTSFEYIVLLAVLLLISIILFIFVRQSIFAPSMNQTSDQLYKLCLQKLKLDQGCYNSTGGWNQSFIPRDAKTMKTCGVDLNEFGRSCDNPSTQETEKCCGPKPS